MAESRNHSIAEPLNPADLNNTTPQLSLFASLPSDEQQRVMTTHPQRAFAPGSVLMLERDAAESFFIVLEGEVEIIKAMGTPDERLLGVRGPGAVLGEMSLFSDDHRRTASVRAQTHVTALEMSRAEYDALLRRHPQIAYDLVRTLSKRLSDSENLTIRDLQAKNKQLEQAYDELQAAQAQLIEKEKLERELAVARNIQRSILLPALPDVAGASLGALMMPSRAVGGDFYDAIVLDDDHPGRRIALVVGDVSDKGVPAALFMALTYSLIRAEVNRMTTPAEALRAVNRHLCGMNSAGMFVTVLLAVLDVGTRELWLARAGHDLPLIADAQGQLLPVPAKQSMPLGLFDEAEIDEQCITLPTGGTLLAYTDGVTEATDARRELFGLARAQRTLLTHQQNPAQTLCDALWQDVCAFVGDAPQHDDVTLLAVKLRNDVAQF
jgi:serine phosphatase RsbU (regulator of sigma subunit)